MNPKAKTRTATEVRFDTATSREFDTRRNNTCIFFHVSIHMYHSAVAKAERDSSRGKKEWTFLSNHGHVLVHVSKSPDARVRDIAESVGITERSALAIISDLEEAGYLTVVRVGRRNQYKVNPRLRFRHPLEANQPISSLLRIFQE